MSIAINRSITSMIGTLNIGLFQFSSLIPALIPVIINLWITNIDQMSNRNQMWKIQYDYIIVGSGPAGAIIANRLAATKYTVLLLEAGGNENFFNEMPALSHVLQQTSMDWQYLTEPQDNACLGLTNRQSHWPRGRVVGGTSTMNDMLYVNGNPKDFDGWEREGATGWSWERVKHHFPIKENDVYNKHLTNWENENEIKEKIESQLTVPTTFSPLTQAFIHSGRKLNYSSMKLNTRSQIGFSLPLLTINKGRRDSSAKIYLDSIRKNENIDIINYAFVKKVLFEGLTAKGVEFERFGQTYKVMVKHEVILSAGAINSPKILMLSGIGPKQHLKSLNIPVIKDLPVGHNLQDQFGTQLAFTVDKNKAINPHKDIDFMQFLKYILFSEGLLSKAPIDSMAFINTDNSSQTPDIQLILKPMTFASDNGLLLKQIHGINDNLWKYYSNHVNKDSFSIDINLLHPKSRGTVELRSSDPYIPPKIDPKYYSSAEDMKTVIKGMKFVTKLIDTKPFKRLHPMTFGKPENCKKHLTITEEFRECFARHVTLTAHSPVGTCRMGQPSSPESVVDPELRVIGVNGLRVADASVMPSLISGNPYATTLMIGQRMANFIIERDQKFLMELKKKTNGVIMNGIFFAIEMVANFYNWRDLKTFVSMAEKIGGNELQDLSDFPLFGSNFKMF